MPKLLIEILGAVLVRVIHIIVKLSIEDWGKVKGTTIYPDGTTKSYEKYRWEFWK
jgi:hypothetical protein